LNATGTSSGTLALNNQTLEGTGTVTGNVVATSGTVRVGGAIMPSAVVPVTTIIDDFNAAGLAQYTKTRVLELNPPAGASAEANVTFSDASGKLVASYAGTVSAAEQVVLLRNDATLAVGQTLRVGLSMPATAAQLDFGLAVSSTATPSGIVAGGDIDTRDTFDAAMVSVRPSTNSLRVNKYVTGSAPDTSSGVVAVDETSVAGLYITRSSNTQFVVGYTDPGATDHVATTLNFASANVGNAVGFYGDLRVVGDSLGSFDNLRITSQQLLAVGETLTVNGNYTQGAGATLALNIFSPTIHDLLNVAGSLTAGGTLDVTLAAGAPTPQAGDAFDILDFTSASSSFATLNLPALSSGLAWNTFDLLTTGILKVIDAGDFNGDGNVNIADYVVWRKYGGSQTEYASWRANFGQPAGGAGTSLNVAVPEPSSISLFVIAIGVAMVRLRSTSLRRQAS
jgi:hypothetical protein